jgi:hypothetical protein
VTESENSKPASAWARLMILTTSPGSSTTENRSWLLVLRGERPSAALLRYLRIGSLLPLAGHPSSIAGNSPRSSEVNVIWESVSIPALGSVSGY